jgi:hypothetical protein
VVDVVVVADVVDVVDVVVVPDVVDVVVVPDVVDVVVVPDVVGSVLCLQPVTPMRRIIIEMHTNNFTKFLADI